MTWVNMYFTIFRRCFTIGGRAARGEYWYFTLVNSAVFFLLWRADLLLHTYNEGLSIGLLTGVFAAVVALPQFCVTVRRLHDTGRNGWWILIQLVPIVGGLWFFIVLLYPSQGGENRYGSSPLGNTEQQLDGIGVRAEQALQPDASNGAHNGGE